MPYGALADLVVLAHFGFVLFVVLGGLLVLFRPGVAWVHLPAALWGAWIEFTGRICPLTPLEKSLRIRAGEPGYQGDFIAHYILPILYPSGLTRGVQVMLGLLVVAGNLLIYGLVWRRHRTAIAAPPPTGSGLTEG